ncbi:hypothetical protein RZS08_00270, partial [Arthrospira platensis SPKY1]|nr:hypothetical protein [Arthrospira platensis SPKY1]
HAAPTVAGQHRHVVHVDQRPALEGGKPLDAVHQPHRRIAVEGQHAEGLRPGGQLAHQVLTGVGRQGLGATGRVACVGIQQHDDGGGIRPVGIVGQPHRKRSSHQPALAASTRRSAQALAVAASR